MKKFFAIAMAAFVLALAGCEKAADETVDKISDTTVCETVSESETEVTEASETAETTAETTTETVTETETTIVENSKEIIPFKYENDTSDNNYSSYAGIDDEIKILLKQAENLYYDFFLRVDETTFNWEKTVTISVTKELDGWEPYSYDDDYSLTGISYDSFKEAFFEVFTNDFVENDLFKRTIYKDYNGELVYYTSFGYVWNNCFDSINFSVADQTENKMTIIGTAHYSDPDDRSITWEHVLEYDIVLTENGWRVNSFVNWD